MFAVRASGKRGVAGLAFTFAGKNDFIPQRNFKFFCSHLPPSVFPGKGEGGR